MIIVGGTYEPPGTTDPPTKKRNRIIDYDGLPPPRAPPLLQPLSSLPLLLPPPPLPSPPPPTLQNLPTPHTSPLDSGSSSFPINASLASLFPTLSTLSTLPPPPYLNQSISSSLVPTRLPELEELPPLPPRNNISDSDMRKYRDGIELPPGGIVGGLHADTAEFPHMARLGIGKNKASISWYCGGTLISDRFILTAAHCIYSQYGTINWARLGDPVQRRYDEFHQVVNNIMHPEYKYPEHYHDLALSELENKVIFNFYISPACIHTELKIPKNIRITVSGWGATGYGEEGSEDLLKADLDLYTYEECTTKYPNTLRKLPRGLNNETQICAGGRKEVKDTCQGDSGGPIQMRGANETYSIVYSVIGVTSFGKICGIVNQPGVYVRLYPYLPWIEEVVWKI